MESKGATPGPSGKTLFSAKSAAARSRPMGGRRFNPSTRQTLSYRGATLFARTTSGGRTTSATPAGGAPARRFAFKKGPMQASTKRASTAGKTLASSSSGDEISAIPKQSATLFRPTPRAGSGQATATPGSKLVEQTRQAGRKRASAPPPSQQKRARIPGTLLPPGSGPKPSETASNKSQSQTSTMTTATGETMEVTPSMLAVIRQAPNIQRALPGDFDAGCVMYESADQGGRTLTFSVRDLVRLRQQFGIRIDTRNMRQIYCHEMAAPPRAPSIRHHEIPDSDTLRKWMRNSGVPVVEPESELYCYVPPIEKVPDRKSIDLVKAALEMRDRPDQEIRDLLPDGFPDLSNVSRRATFRQKLKNVPYSKMAFSAVAQGYASTVSSPASEAVKAAVKAFTEEARQVCATNLYGHGTYKGLVGRLSVGWEVHRTALADLGDNRAALYDERAALGTLVDKVMPMNKLGAPLEGFRPRDLLEDGKGQLTFPDGRVVQLLAPKPGSHSGAPWREQDLRVDTVVADIAMAEVFIARMRIQGAAAAVRAMPFMRLNHGKSKNEVRTVEKHETKARFIYPVAAPAMVLELPMVTIFNQGLQSFYRTDESLLLHAVPWCIDGMERVLKRVLGHLYGSEPIPGVSEGKVTLFYADNLQLFETVEIAGQRKTKTCSIDINSMESTTTRERAKAAFWHYSSRISGVDPDEDPTLGGLLAEDYGRTVRDFLPNNVVNQVGVVLNEEYEIPGLPSGKGITLLCNCYGTAPCVQHLNTQDDAITLFDGGPSGVVEKSLQKLGLRYKIESKIPGGRPLFVEDYLNTPMGIAEPGEICELELLGFGFLKVRLEDDEGVFFNKVFGVLTTPRFLKMLLFRRGDLYEKPTIDPTTLGGSPISPADESNLKTMIKCMGAYLFQGGFHISRAPATTALFIQARSALVNAHGSVDNAVRTHASIVRNLAAEAEEDLSVGASKLGIVTTAALIRGSPSFVDVAMAHKGGEVAKEVAKRLKIPRDYNDYRRAYDLIDDATSWGLPNNPDEW